MHEAEERNLLEVADDCARVLGPGIEIFELQRDQSSAGIHLTLRYRLGDHAMSTSAAGPTVVAAHAALREALAVDRLRLGFSAVVGGR